MGKKISEIIIKSIGIKSSLVEKYLIETQKKSGYGPDVFFELIQQEIQILKKNYNPLIPIRERMRGNDYLNPEWHGKTLIRIGEEYDLLFRQLSSLDEALEQLLTKIQDQEIIDSESVDTRNIIQKVGTSNKLVNKFNAMSIAEVESIFKPLVFQKNKAKQYWMTQKDFDIFLRRSFGMENFEKPKINFGKTEKGCVIKLFHIFYQKSVSKSEITCSLKGPYVALLENAFATNDFYNLNHNNFSSRASCHWII